MVDLHGKQVTDDDDNQALQFYDAVIVMCICSEINGVNH